MNVPFFLKHFEEQIGYFSFETVILFFGRMGGKLSTWMCEPWEEYDKPNISSSSTFKFLEVNLCRDKPSEVKIAHSISLEAKFFLPILGPLTSLPLTSQLQNASH